MIERVLRLAAVAASLVVLLSWGMFAWGESMTATGRTQAELAGQVASRDASPSPDDERARERVHSALHEDVDDVNDVLVAPFAGLTDGSDSAWLRRTASMLLALLVYGFGGGYLARWASGRARRMPVPRPRRA